MTMRRTFFACFFLLTLGLRAAAQCPTCTGNGRYADSLFTCSKMTPNIQYGTGLWDWSWTNLLCLNVQLPPYQTRLPLKADFYEPCGDTASCRPLLIAIHGGAWAGGDKSDLAVFSDFFAKKGYAVASINYRLSIPNNPLCFDVDADSIRMLRAAFRAIQDAKAAVRFFRAHAAEYRIDPENIFAVGVSAGAFTALGVGYLNDPDERPGVCAARPELGNWFNNLYFPDMGSIEGDGGNPAFSSSVRAVVNLSGALFDLDWLDGAGDPSLCSFHGTADDVVPFGAGCVLPALINANIYHHCVRVQGSKGVQQRAASLGMDAQLFTFPNGGHGYTPPEIAVMLSETTKFLCKRMAPVSAVGEASPGAGARVWPNPATEHFLVETPTANGVWRLFDAQGRGVQSVAIQDKKTAVWRRGLPAGWYAWQWQTDRASASGVLVLE